MKTRKIEIGADIPAKKSKPHSSTGFSERVIDYLRPGGREISFSDGEVIIHRGDPGKAFYVVLSGNVEVRLAGGENRYLPLTRLGKHSSFGEMALIRGEPASADIVTLGPVTVLEYPAENFRRALAESEDFRNELLARMAQNLHDTSTEAWTFFQRAEAFNMLVHMDIPLSEPLVSKSTRMRKVEKNILQLAREQEQNAKPALICGEAGTGKLFSARKIHNLSGSPSAPFIVVDCSRLDEIEAGTLLFGASQLGEAPGRLEGFGALHLAHGGTLVLQNIDSLDQNSRKLLGCYIDLLNLGGKTLFPFVKIMATTRENPRNLVKTGRLPEGLLAKLYTLRIPGLKDRKADILPLAGIFLKKLAGQSKSNIPLRLSKNVEHALLSLRYRSKNVKELREAVELAALFCEDGEIREEHIFVGPKDKGIPPEFDLGEIPLIQRILHGKGKRNPLVILRAAILGVFTAIILLCLLQSGGKIGHTANSMIWAVWEPVLIFSFLFIGHMWCTICPLSTVGTLIQRLGSLKHPPSQWMKKYGVWLAVLGFFLIVWTEKVYHMTERPFASAILLLSLISGAVLFGLVYQREVWCRYICPLGALASGYGLSAMLHVRARPHICSTYCTTHECYKGTADSPGCSVFHHPLYISDGHNCKFCFKCLELCPHESVRFYMRPFLQPVWLFGGFAHILTPFALAVFFLSIVMLVSNQSDWIKDPLDLTIVALSAVFFGALLNGILPRLLSGKKDPDTTTASRAAFGLLVLAWGPLMAYQLSNIPALTAIRLYAPPGSLPANLFAGKELTLLVVLQLAVIFLALLLAAIVFWRIRVQAEKEDVGIDKKGWNFLLILSAVYALFAVFVTLS